MRRFNILNEEEYARLFTMFTVFLLNEINVCIWCFLSLSVFMLLFQNTFSNLSLILMSAWNSLPNVKMNHRSARTPMDHTNVFAKKDCIG